MSYQVVALLDRPSPASFGMVPFVARDESGTLLPCGLSGNLSDRLSPVELDSLIAEGHALAVEGPLLYSEAPPTDQVAGWLGEQFQQQAHRIDAPPVRIPRDVQKVGGAGRFWIGSPQSVYSVLIDWLKAAAADCFQDRRAELANLMAWALPDREETQAALWYTKASDEEREKDLEWWLRLAHDAGENISRSDLERRLEHVVERYKDAVSRRLKDLDSQSYLRSLSESPFLALAA